MDLKNVLGKAVWKKLTWKDRASIAVIYMQKGMAAAVMEASKRAARNTFSNLK